MTLYKRLLMGNRYRFLFVLLAAALTAACDLTRPEQEITPAGEVTISARLEAPVIGTDVRTSLAGDASTVVWNTGDAIALLSDGGHKSRFTLAFGSGASEASFSGEAAGTAPWYAFYPYDENVSLAAGELHFNLPAQQAYTSGTFAQGTNPTLARIDALSETLQFKNLCGVLCLDLTGSGILSKVVLHDLGGNMLWGDATVTLDGKEGTAQQTLTLTGGDNTLTLTGSIPLSVSSPQTLFFVVPAGALDRGFSVVAFDQNGDACGIAQTQVANTVNRSAMMKMPQKELESFSESADTRARGYYKDLFMDGGIKLTSRTTLPAATYLNLDCEFYAAGTAAIDSAMQKALFVGSDEDKNGVLLYPDGEPRFRCIYVNGGSSLEHGASLGADGRNRIRAYYANGGSYVGTCAGCLLASKGSDNGATTTSFFGIWPGHTYHSKTDRGIAVTRAHTSLTIEPDCPLLNYYDFGNDMQIDDVLHNGGCYMGDNSTYPAPAGTEILLRFLTPGPDSTKLNGSVNAWAYKATEESGRLCVTGSHPEVAESGEQLDLFSAMIRYASDGNGCVTPKGTLSRGVVRTMDKGWEANQPAFARIGDKQYHHFTFKVPYSIEELSLTLRGIDTDCDLYLALAKDRTAWICDADYQLTGKGNEKTLTLRNVSAGIWSVAVYCPDTIISTQTKYSSSAYYYQYSGNTAVLNGIPYSILVNWGENGSVSYPLPIFTPGTWGD